MCVCHPHTHTPLRYFCSPQGEALHSFSVPATYPLREEHDRLLVELFNQRASEEDAHAVTSTAAPTGMGNTGTCCQSELRCSVPICERAHCVQHVHFKKSTDKMGKSGGGVGVG